MEDCYPMEQHELEEWIRTLETRIKRLENKCGVTNVSEFVNEAIKETTKKNLEAFDKFLSDNGEGIYNGVQVVKITDKKWNSFEKKLKHGGKQ